MFKKSPNIFTLENVLSGIAGNSSANINDKWVPARPLGYSSWRYRLKATWLVFSGRADVLIWPEGQ